MKFSGPILIIIAALLWAADGIIRRSLYGLPPITIIFFEHLIGFAILLPFAWKLLFKERLTKKQWFLVILISLLSGLVGTLFFTTALLKVNFISFSVVFLLQKLQPIFAVSTAAIFLKEKITQKYILWGALALVAAYFVTFPNGVVNLASGSGTVIAAFFALGAAAAWGSSTTFSKMVLVDKSHTYTTAIRFLVTSIAAFILVIVMGKFGTLGTVTLSEFARFVIIALSTGMVALLIYYKGLKLTPVRVTTILELTFPFVAVLIDIFLYHHTLILSQFVAAIILIFSMYQITRLQQKHEI